MNVLILCTGNSARSILAEALLNAMGKGWVRAFSAGSAPAGRVHPMALEVLAMEGISTVGLHSKSWTAFAGDGAPQMDLVITVCDSAAQESCPIWPGAPIQVHWSLPDPAAVTGDDRVRLTAFLETAEGLRKRFGRLMSLPQAVFDDRAALKEQLDSIGLMREGAA